MIREIFPLLKFEIIAVFVNTWAADYKYPVMDCKYLKNQKYFLRFFFHFWNLHQILNIFKKRMVLRANVFRKLQNVKDLVRPLTKKRCFRTSFDSQHLQWSQTLVKSSWEHFYHISSSLLGEIIWDTFPLLKFEMIEVFVNTWTADYKYPFQDCENFLLPTQMKLS